MNPVLHDRSLLMVAWTSGCDARHTPSLQRAMPPAPIQFRPAYLPPPSGILITPPLFLALGNHRWDGQMLARTIHRNKSQVCRADMVTRIFQVVLDKHLHSHFHGSVKHPVHRRTQNDQVADTDWE